MKRMMVLDITGAAEIAAIRMTTKKSTTVWFSTLPSIRQRKTNKIDSVINKKALPEAGLFV
jgi:hypothetical protein